MSEQTPDPSTYEGEEGTPPATPPPPVRYQPEASAPAPAPAAQPANLPTPSPSPATSPATAAGPVDHRPTTGDRLAAVSGPLSFVLFMVFGFLGGWAWSWIFFMLPGILYAWNRGGRDH